MRRQYLFVQPLAGFARIPASHLQNQTLCVRGIRRVANKSTCLLAPRTSLAVVSGLRVGSFAELFLRRRPRCLYSASSDPSADLRHAPVSCRTSIRTPSGGRDLCLDQRSERRFGGDAQNGPCYVQKSLATKRRPQVLGMAVKRIALTTTSERKFKPATLRQRTSRHQQVVNFVGHLACPVSGGEPHCD